MRYLHGACEHVPTPLTYTFKHKYKTYAHEMYIRIKFINRFNVSLHLFNTRP